jgi:hypothetical protein
MLHAMPISSSLIILIILDEEYKSRSFSLCSFLYPPVTSLPFGLNILLSTLFSNILSRQHQRQVSHQYRTTAKCSGPNSGKHYTNGICPLISP